MYAVIESGGKQYRVSIGDKLKLEKLPVDQGKTVEFDKVLAVSDEGELQVGTPLLEGAKVIGNVLSHGRGDKVRVVKFKRRKSYHRVQGHRQFYTEVEITQIGEKQAEAASVKKAAKKPAAKEATEKAAATKAPAETKSVEVEETAKDAE